MPATYSAADTARVISRLLRKNGFLMTNRSNRHRWTEGFYVSRVGYSNLVSVDYYMPSYTLTDRARRREERVKVRRFLTDRGYVLDTNYETAVYIQCERD